MFEGKHIHFSPIDNKPLCSYSKKICKQRRLNGYAFCIRHILEDGSAPFKQCSFVAKFKKCTNPIPSHEERGYCNSHMQVAGMLPKKVRRPSKKEKSGRAADKGIEDATRIWKGSNLSCAPGHTTIILPTSLPSDVGKLKFSDRLKALLKTGGSHGVSLDEDAEEMEAMIEMDEEGIDDDDEGDSAADQMDYDPYAFSEPEPFGKVINFGDSSRLKSSGDSVKFGNALVQQCRVSPASIASRKLKPVKHRSLDSGSNGHRPVVPAAIRPSLSVPMGHSEGVSVSAETSSETMNRLAAKIAADKVLGKHHRKFRGPLFKISDEALVSSPSHSSSSSSSSPHHRTSASAPEPPPLHPTSRARPHVIHTVRSASQANSASGGHSRQNAQPVVHRRPSNTALGSIAPSGPARRLPFHGVNSVSSSPNAVSSMTPTVRSPSVKSPTRILSLGSSTPHMVSVSAATSSASAAAQRKERSLLEEQLLGVKGAALMRSGQSGNDHSNQRRHASSKTSTDVIQQSSRGSRVKVELPPPPSPGSPPSTSSTPRRSRAGHRPITYRAPSNKPHPSPAHPVGGTPSETPSPANNTPSVVTIPSRRYRGGRGAITLVKAYSSEALKNIQDVWEDMRLFKQDLYPLGLESSGSEDTDSEPECGFYQRHWFTPPFDYHISASLRLSPNVHSSHHSHHDLKPRAKVKALLARTSSSSESRCLEERRHHSRTNHPASLADLGARGVAYDEWKARGFGKIPCPSDNIKGSRMDENTRQSMEDTSKRPVSLRDQRLLRTREDLRRRCGQIGGACSLLGRSRRSEIKTDGIMPKMEPGVKVKVEAGMEESLPVEGEAWQERMVRAVIAAARKSGPNRTGALLRDGLRLTGGKKGQNRPHTRHRNRSKLTMLVTRTCAYRSGDTGDSEGGESGEESRKQKAGSGSFTKTNGYCGSPALPCTRHCPRHVMYNVDQLLFEHCTAKFADNTQCCAPVFDVSRDTPLCPEHARKRDNYDRMCAEVKPKRARKKAKPSAMTRPSKRGKKKRRSASVPAASVESEDHVIKEENERAAQYTSPMSVLARRSELGKSTSLSPSRREILGEDDGSKESSSQSASLLLAGVLNTSRVRHKGDDEEDAEQGDLDDDEEVASALSGACPEEEEEEDEEEEDEEGDMEEATLAAAAESLTGVDEEEEVEEECVDGVVEEEAIASVLGVGGRNRVVVEEEVDGLPLLDPSEELGNQASRLLEEHDLTNVLNQIPPEAFNDLFIEGKNGEYEPTREETEELERALEAVDKDVKSLEKLSRQGGGNSGSGVVVVGGGPIVGATEVVGAGGGSATAGLDLDSILDEHTLHQIATSGAHTTSGVGSGVVGISLSQMVVTSQGRMPSASICGTIPSMAGLPGGSSIVENGAIGSVAMLGDGGSGVPNLVPGMHVVNGTTSEGGIAPLYCSQTSQGAAISAVHQSTYDLLHQAAHLDASVGQMAPVAGPGAYITTIQTTHSAPTTSPSSTPSVLAFNGGDGVLLPQAGGMVSSFPPPQLAYATTPGYPNGYIVDNTIPPSQLVSVQKHHLLQQQNHFVPMNQVPQAYEHYIGSNHMAVEVEVATGMKRQQDHQVVAGPVDALDLFGNGGIVDAASLFASPTPGMVAPPTGIATSGPHASPSGTHLTSQQHQMLMMAAAAAESDVTGSETGS